MVSDRGLLKMFRYLCAAWILPVIATATSAQEVSWQELNIRVAASITATQIKRLSEITEPVIYTIQPGESLAGLSDKRYGIKGRMRDALALLNPELVHTGEQDGRDFFWQPLPPGTVV